VVAAEPGHVVAPDQRRDEWHHGRAHGLQAGIGQRQVAGVAQRDRHHRGQVAAGAVAADRQARGIDAQLGGVITHPARGRDAVVHRGGETMLGSHAVVHRDHGAAGGNGQLAAQRVVGVQVADHPATAVEVHQHRRRGLPGSVGGEDVVVREGSEKLVLC